MRAQALSLVCLLALVVVCLVRSSTCELPNSDDDADDRQAAAEPALGCSTPFGSVIGRAHDVTARSNCNGNFTSNFTNSINVSCRSVFTGLEWQCVEYARRFLIRRRNVTFGSVVGASDIWNMRFVRSVVSSRRYPFLQFANGVAGTPPAIGDLIIYPIQPGGFPFGHVAVVVGVSATTVEVAEQNWSSHLWPNIANNYSRQLLLNTTTQSGRVAYAVLDPEEYEIAGWKRATKR